MRSKLEKEDTRNLGIPCLIKDISLNLYNEQSSRPTNCEMGGNAEETV